MIYLDYGDHHPLYEQVREKIKALIIRGVLNPHDQIPSVREMAVSLTVNPNTIQKAYKDLESDGYIYSVKGKGSFVAVRSSKVNERRLEEIKAQLRPILQELRFLGLTDQNTAALIRSLLPDSAAPDQDLGPWIRDMAPNQPIPKEEEERS
jgi:GntR family transcriptional regulator